MDNREAQRAKRNEYIKNKIEQSHKLNPDRPTVATLLAKSEQKSTNNLVSLKQKEVRKIRAK